ncbi:MAG TPA: hypothetical protein VFX21_09810, partial [Acidimicrobiia bacterium]|nr:hypothetical protein [Acidimicrobiia bacterium]
MRKALIALFVVVLTGVAVAGVAWAANDNSKSAAHPRQDVLADTRRATNQYRDVSAAIADGFADLGLCVPMMGEHYTLGG